MTRRLPLILTLVLSAGSLVACSQPRAERPTTEPIYSVRAENPTMAASDLWPQQRFAETSMLADADLLSTEGNDPALHATTASLDEEVDDLLRSE